MTHLDYARAARHITPEAVTKTLMEMVDIASPTGREGELAKYIVARLTHAGFNASLQEVSENRPNAVGFAIVLTTPSPVTRKSDQTGCGSMHPRTKFIRVKYYFVSDYRRVKSGSTLDPG